MFISRQGKICHFQKHNVERSRDYHVMISWRIFRASPPKTQFKERVGTSQYSLVIPLGRVSVHFRLQVVCGKFIGTHNFWSRISLRSWRYCVGARLKFWRRSRVPKKGSRDEAVEIPPARKPRYFEYSAHQCAEKRIGRGPYICQSCSKDDPSHIFPS